MTGTGSKKADECLLVGGSAGGKSTFAGALMYYLKEESDLNTNIQILFENSRSDREEFSVGEDIYRRMKERKKYPKKTEEGQTYGIRCFIEYGHLLPREVVFDIMDIPGELQEANRSRNKATFGDYIDSILPGRVAEQEELVKEYQEQLKPRMLDSETNPTDEDWQKILEYRYLRSNKVICLMNLHKLWDDKTPDPDILDQEQNVLEIANDKPKKLILVTACDVIDYDPDEFNGKTSLMRGTIRDTELADEIQSSLPLEDSSTVSTLLRQVQRNDSDFSFFGVSVPAENPKDTNKGRGEHSIKGTPEKGKLDVRGYDQVVEWLTM